MDDLSDYNDFWYTFDKKFNSGFVIVDENLNPIRVNDELQYIVDKEYKQKIEKVMEGSASSFNAFNVLC